MKKLKFLLFVPLISGCSTTNITKLTQALAKDPAIIVVNVGTVYGTVKLTRVGCVTNGMSVSPDGTVTIK
jgi:hypothetical protein